MTLEQLRTEIKAMPAREQDELAAYLVHLRHQRDTSIATEIARKIDDKNPANWITLEELRGKWRE
jgi:hypothetical protein